MSSPSPPFPPRDNAVTADTGDVRAEFAALSCQTPRDEAAETGFLENKIELIRSDPNLTEKQKQDAIAEVRRRLGVAG